MEMHPTAMGEGRLIDKQSFSNQRSVRGRCDKHNDYRPWSIVHCPNEWGRIDIQSKTFYTIYAFDKLHYQKH